MMLEIKKPIIFFDIEATGLDISQDRIVEIAMIKLYPDGQQEEKVIRVNPEITIPDEVIAIHGISNEDVANAPRFEDVAHEIETFIGDADLAGYNSNKFDVPILAEELLRAGSQFDLMGRKFIDVQNIFHKMEQRTLAAAYQFYCQKELTNAHNASADTKATMEVLLAQLDRYNDLEKNVSFLANFSATKGDIIDFAGRLALNENGEAIYNFGKHKGKTLEKVNQEEPGYYGWMLNANFPLTTKAVLRKEMDKIKLKTSKNTDAPIEDKLKALQEKFQKK
ncbi:MAG: 3'-5' exonuclease [Crocinitomicaceae bacterium]|nr:3'-5' exonuclease [Crocinitomicaceae bacterium]